MTPRQEASAFVERLLALGAFVGVPERVVLELPVMDPYAPLDEMSVWTDADLQRYLLTLYARWAADQEPTDPGELPHDLEDPQ